MKQDNRFSSDMLDFNTQDAINDKLWLGMMASDVTEQNGTVFAKIPFRAQMSPKFVPDGAVDEKNFFMSIRAYEGNIVRCSISFKSDFPEDDSNVMFEKDQALSLKPLRVRRVESGWDIADNEDVIRMKINNGIKPIKKWSEMLSAPQYFFDAAVYPDGITCVPFMANDTFTASHFDSVSLGFVERNQIPVKCVFSLHALYDEKFAGTGERFAPLNLSGKTITLENEDALGANSRRAYKNIPFYLSSKGYGLLIMSSYHMRLSFADISTRAVQGLIEDDKLDLFFIGGIDPEKIVYSYRKLTGFPRNVPIWSYGVWMSRMSYFSADETIRVVKRLREEEFPCDVIHLDTGWFKKDWQCEWEFNEKTFPDPKGYMDCMREMGIKVSLWQTPNVSRDTKHFKTAVDNGYLPVKKSTAAKDASDFGTIEYGGRIDFSNPKAVKWYQGLLGYLFDLGAEVIKTDFGEKIDMDAKYCNLSEEELHNLYALLYQKAAYEITEKYKGRDQSIIWARAGWTGCQRYPVHWGGDCASTWDGLAGTIRAGLHLGISGFGFWSHDVPGFHGLPDFMNNWPDNDLYVRWTQTGVFTSHIRYHGASPREPYEYPEIMNLVREWWKLRYALIPYFAKQGRKVTQTGYPFLRALLFHHSDDPFCWNIDDEFYCGDNLLIAPVMNSCGKRNIYLPEGYWTEFWTGEVIKGPIMLKSLKVPLSQIPIFCVTGSKIEVYPEIVKHTGEMDASKVQEIIFDGTYKGFARSLLGKNIVLQT